jgi:hypothetical protein
MAEQLVKLFSKEIQSNLFPKNEFYKRSRLDAGIDAAVGVYSRLLQFTLWTQTKWF